MFGIKKAFLIGISSLTFLSMQLCALSSEPKVTLSEKNQLLSNFDFGPTTYLHYRWALTTLDLMKKQIHEAMELSKEYSSEQNFSPLNTILQDNKKHYSLSKIIDKSVLVKLQELHEKFNLVIFCLKSDVGDAESLAERNYLYDELMLLISNCYEAIDDLKRQYAAGSNYKHRAAEIVKNKKNILPEPVKKTTIQSQEHNSQSPELPSDLPQNIGNNPEEMNIPQLITQLVQWAQEHPLKATLGLAVGAFGLYKFYKWINE